LSNLEPMNR